MNWARSCASLTASPNLRGATVDGVFGNWGLIKGAQRLREDARRAAREAEVQALIEDAMTTRRRPSRRTTTRGSFRRDPLQFLGLPSDTLFGCPKAPPTHIVISLLAGGGRAKIPIPLEEGRLPRNY